MNIPSPPQNQGKDMPAGLDCAEAARRLAREGRNELPRSHRRTPWGILLETLRQPMFGLLLGAGGIYLAIGDAGEGLILLLFASASVSITVIQESRTERVLERLRDLTSPRALVIRDGEMKRVAGAEVVRGDLLLVAEGDRVAADARLIRADNLQIDESLITGEAHPVSKHVAATGLSDTQMPRPGEPRSDAHVYGGALVISGQGLAEVRATGPRSEIGRIGTSLEGIGTEPSRLTQETRRFTRGFALLSLTVAVLAIILFGLLRGGWLEAFLAGIALGMSLLPEEFPLVLTVFMAMGAWRISRAHVLTRRAAAIETLGAATALCSDKTGTLTENRMAIAEIRAHGLVCQPLAETGPLAPPFAAIVEDGILASRETPFDPMEKAFHALNARIPMAGHPRSDWAREREYPLSPQLLCMTNIWRSKSGGAAFAAAKGAPEAIATLCRMTAAETARLLADAAEMAGRGLRVLGIARAEFDSKALPGSQTEFLFAFAGLVGLTDPLRAGVPAAVAECRRAGIRVLMITGDHPDTAQAIAREAGIKAHAVLTGSEMNDLDDTALQARLAEISVFARVMPEQKLRLVRALKARGEIVAMTGDGVNDAPSLKAADIGIAMGGRGSDVAREAAAIVLLNDDFTSIVHAIGLGRRIYDNLQKAMAYIVAVHVPIAGLALLPLLFGWPLILWPVHIAFLEMAIDPISSVVFEAEAAEADIMKRPPRPPLQRLFSPSLILWGALQGLVALLAVAMLYVTVLDRAMPEAEARAVAFTAVILTNFALVLVNHSFHPAIPLLFRRDNPALLLVVPAILGFLCLTLYWPTAQSIFRFAAPNLVDIGYCMIAGLALLLTLEAAKLLWRRPRT